MNQTGFVVLTTEKTLKSNPKVFLLALPPLLHLHKRGGQNIRTTWHSFDVTVKPTKAEWAVSDTLVLGRAQLTSALKNK